MQFMFLHNVLDVDIHGSRGVITTVVTAHELDDMALEAPEILPWGELAGARRSDLNLQSDNISILFYAINTCPIQYDQGPRRLRSP